METIDQAGLVVVSPLLCSSGMAAPSPSQPGQEAQVFIVVLAVAIVLEFVVTSLIGGHLAP